MNNIEELKKAALGANLHGWTGFEDALNDDGYSEAVSKFIGHCRPSEILALIAQLEAAQKEISELREEEQEWLSLADMHEHLNHQNNLNVEHRNKIHDLKEKLLAAEAALSAANERLSKPVVLPDDGLEDCINMWPENWRNDFDTGYNFGIWRCEQNIKAAGFTVEGE
ncbi:TPA: hypothetical protein ACJTDP_000219 [Yersinia enterocolitica]